MNHEVVRIPRIVQRTSREKREPVAFVLEDTFILPKRSNDVEQLMGVVRNLFHEFGLNTVIEAHLTDRT